MAGRPARRSSWSIQKQPTADTVDLTRRLEAALADLKGSVPPA